jgi:hypothetical protein
MNSQKYPEFDDWKQTFKANFETDSEEYYRRTIFYHNLALIAQHNSKSGQTYKMGVNQFTIFSEEEFAQRFLTGSSAVST